ncbi:MAG: DUF3618 domain-containing protein [Alphaproteobacteria bacterium]|nr:DUF3618 domain-containing protein [Alphaproteobacteria bacterium]
MSDIPAIERDSEQHRANIAALVDELRAHVTPGEIANQLLGPDAGRDMVRMLVHEAQRQFRRNPVPVALIVTGVAWIVLADSLRRQRVVPLHDGLDYQGYDELEGAGSPGAVRRIVDHLREARARPRIVAAQGQQELTMTSSGKNGDGRLEPGEAALQNETEGSDRSRGFVGRTVQKGRDAAKSAANRTQEMATGFAHTALHKSGEAISSAADAVGEAASSVKERTTEMARRTGRAASNTASRAGSGVGQLAREQPLLVAGVGFAIGVALGALLPLSRLENSMLGEQAEKLKGRARELADEGYEKVKSVAQRTYDAAAETIRSETEKSEAGTTTTGDKTVGTQGSEGASDDGANAYRH